MDSFTSTASTADSKVHLTNLSGLTVDQNYHPSASPSLYEDTVTITNTTGATVTDLKYVRVMDWDVPPTEFNEFVTLKGATLGDLEVPSDQGFATANPLAGDPGGFFAGTVNADFTDSGPFDHGAYFRFNFGSLADGASKTFTILYGAAPNEAAALAALIAAER